MSVQYLNEAYAKEVSGQRALLQGAAGAGIGFALHQSAEALVAPSLFVQAVAVLFWALSFTAGIFNSHAKQAAIKLNIAILNRQAAGVDAAEFDADFDKYSRRATRTYHTQLWCLLIGAVLYVAGHGLQIAERSTSSAPVAAPVSGSAKVASLNF